MMNKYILENWKPVLCPDLMKWAEWYEKSNRHIEDTRKQIYSRLPRKFKKKLLKERGFRNTRYRIEAAKEIRISTVFLGLDHNFGFKGKPVLFETMVFGGVFNQSQDRYCTLEEAKQGHAKWCEKVFKKGRQISHETKNS